MATSVRTEPKGLGHKVENIKSNMHNTNKRSRGERNDVVSDSSTLSVPAAKRTKPSHLPPTLTPSFGDSTTQSLAEVSNTTASAAESSKAQSALSPSGPDLSAYTVSTMNIISSSHIQNKVKAILETLATFSFVPPARPNIVQVSAKSNTASKCITVIEIAKREIAKGGGKWYQYTRLGQTTVERPRKTPKTEHTDGRRLGTSADEGEGTEEKMDLDGEETEEPEFETMKTPLERALEGKPRIRAVPTISVYLSRVRVDNLKRAFGEQTNAST